MLPTLTQALRKQQSTRLLVLLENIESKLNGVVFPETLDGWRLDIPVDFALTNLEQLQLQQECRAAGWGCVVKCHAMDKDLVTIFIPL